MCHDSFMADNEFEIKAKLTADTKGAKETTQALKEVKVAAEETTKTIKEITDEAKDASQSIKDVKGTVDEVTQAVSQPAVDDTFARYSKSAQKAKEQFLELKAALKAMREELSSMGDDPYAKANLGTVADFENLMPQKGAFSSQNIVELDEATRKVKELTQAFEMLMDTGKQMTVDPSEEVEKVIKAHEKRIDAAEKAYDQEEKASAKAAAKAAADEEKKKEAAEKYFTSYMNGQKRIAATLKELQVEYDKYIQKLNAARAAGDKDGARDAIANLRQLKSQMSSVERQAEIYNRRMLVTARRFTNIAAGAMNAASALSGLSGTMGMLAKGMSSIASGAVFGGAWGAAFGAATVGIEALVQHLNEQTAKLNTELKVTDDRLQAVVKKYSELRSKDVLDAYNKQQTSMIESQTKAYREQTEEIERVFRWKTNLNQLEKGGISADAARKKAENEYKYQAGEMNKTELALNNLEIDKDAYYSTQDVNRQNQKDAINKAKENYRKEQDALDKAVANEEKASSNLLNSTEYVKVVKDYEADANRIASNRRDLDLTEKRLANLEDAISIVKRTPQKRLLANMRYSDLGHMGISERDKKEIFDKNLDYKTIASNMEKFANEKLKGEIEQRKEWDKEMQKSNKARDVSIKAMLEKLTAQGLLTPEETYIGVMSGDTAEEREKARLARYIDIMNLAASRMDESKKTYENATKARKDQETKTDAADVEVFERENDLQEFEERSKAENAAFDAQVKAQQAAILRQNEIEKEQRNLDLRIEGLEKAKKGFEENKKNAEKRLRESDKKGKNNLAEETLDSEILKLPKGARDRIGISDSALGKLMSALRDKGKDGHIDGQEQTELNVLLDTWIQEFPEKKKRTAAQQNLINKVAKIMRKIVDLTNDPKGETNKEVESWDNMIQDSDKEIEQLRREKESIGKEGWKPKSLQSSKKPEPVRTQSKKPEPPKDTNEFIRIPFNGPTKVTEITDQVEKKIPEPATFDLSSIESGVSNIVSIVIQKMNESRQANQAAIDAAGERIVSLNDSLSKLDVSVKGIEKIALKAEATANSLMNWKKFNPRV